MRWLSWSRPFHRRLDLSQIYRQLTQLGRMEAVELRFNRTKLYWRINGNSCRKRPV